MNAHLFRSSLWLSTLAFLAAMNAHSAAGANLYWSGNGSALGGGGTWDTSTAQWGSAAAGPFSAVWNNANNDTAIFGGTAGRVTNSVGVTVGGLRFDTTAYVITNDASTLTFGAANNTLYFGSVAAATISGTVAGSGNVAISGNPAVASTVTFNGASAGGWSGTTTINPGMTLAVEASYANRALGNTAGIIINGGAVTTGSGVTSANTAVDFFNDTAPITFNGGGSFTWRPVNANTFNETNGAVTVNSGQVSILTGSQSGPGIATLTLGGLTRNDASSVWNLSVGNGGALSGGGLNRIVVTGAGTTPDWTNGASSNPIIGPWATTGTSAGAGDYAVYTNASVAAAATAVSAESTWTTLGNAYTTSNATKTAATLTGTRNITALRSITASSGAIGVDVTGNVITNVGHLFLSGDVVSFGGTAPGGLTTGAPYYVVNPATDTFQVAATSGGTVIDLTSAGTSPNVTGGLVLPSGINLGTYGILNASAASMPIGGNGGVVTLPAAGAGRLFVSTIGAGIGIDAPINDNGGALTLVKSGSSTLFLRSTNSTYSGGTVINAGTLNYTADANLGASGSRNLTINGTVTLTGFDGSVLDQLSVGSGAVATISPNNITFATATGSGALSFGSGAKTLTLTNAGGFQGDLRIFAGNNGPVVKVGSLSDASGAGNIQFVGGSGDSNQKVFFQLFNNAGSLTLNNRRIEFQPKPSNWSFRNAVIQNNNGSASNTIVINTALLNQTDRNHELTLGGTNPGDNTFAGVIGDSIRGSFFNGTGQLNLYKFEAGKWIVSGANTFTGRVIVNQGTLSIGILNEPGVAGPLGTGSVVQLGGRESLSFNGATGLYLSSSASGTLEYTGGAATSTRTFLVGGDSGGDTGGGGIANNGSGALTFSAATFNAAVTNATVTRTLTLGGTNILSNEIQGVVQNNSSISNGLVALNKSGTGTWVLSGSNTYSGTTTVSAGKLMINGDQTGATNRLNVATNATLGGTGVIGGDTTMTNGARLEFNLSTAPVSHNKLELASGKSLTFLGASVLTITSSGGASTGLYTLLTVPGGISGSAPGVTNLPAGWTADAPAIIGNDLVINITSTGGGPVTPSPTLLTNSLSGSTLTLSWPAGQNWRLQEQTNALSVGLRTNWVYVTDNSVNTTNITLDKTKPTTFYRLVYP